MIDYARYNVPQIKKELKKRGLRQSGKKADLVARLIDAVEKEAFHFFPKLPAELRRNIWLHALPKRRIVTLEGRLHSFSTSAPSFSAALNLMLVCKDAYSAASARYRPVPNPQWCKARAAGENRPMSTNANYHDDVFYLCDYAAIIRELEHWPNYLDLKLVKTVAIPIWEFEESLETGAIEQLLKLPSLEEVILVQDLRPAPKVTRRPQSWGRQLLNMLAPVELEPPSWLQSYTTESGHWFWQPLATAFCDMASEVPELEPLMNVKVFFSEFL